MFVYFVKIGHKMDNPKFDQNRLRIDWDISIWSGPIINVENKNKNKNKKQAEVWARLNSGWGS